MPLPTNKRNTRKDVEIRLTLNDDSSYQKLVKSKSNMPSWLLGEEIAKQLDLGKKIVQINLSDLFLRYNTIY